MSQAGINSFHSSVSNIVFVEDSGIASIIGGTLNVVGGPGIQTSGFANTITISNTAGTVWQTVTSADNPVVLAAQSGYFPDGGTPVQFYLPPGANVGDTFVIAGEGNLWTIGQFANQEIRIGLKTSTTGVTGSVTATSISDTLWLVCMVQNLVFKAISWNGNPTVV